MNGSNAECNQAERFASLVAGGILLGVGLRRANPLRLVLAIAGGALLLRGAKGHLGVAEAIGAQPEDAAQPSWRRQIFVRKSITISRPRAEVYAYWRNFENLPTFMRHLIEVKAESERLSHWKARGPAGMDVSWDAELTLDNENEIIAWNSLPGAQIENSGEVRFEDAPGNRGTIVRVQLTYRPPAGVLGAVVAKMFGEEPHGQIADDLRRLRSLLETGEVPTTEGQSSDRARKAKGLIQTHLGSPALPELDEETKNREATVR
ncbi:MAG: SRPBCC family protein [Fimbriimonas sp.]